MDYPKNTIYPKASNIDKYYSCRDPKGYFKIDNYFSELTDDVQRVQCLSNLGISNLKHEWGNIQGDINLQQDLIQLINKNISESIHTGISNLVSKEEFTNAIGDLTNYGGHINGLEGNSQLEGVADMFEGNACELATLVLNQDKYLENKINSSSKTIQSEISSIQDDIKGLSSIGGITEEQLKEKTVTSIGGLKGDVNVKTINGASILGEGNIEISTNGDVTDPGVLTFGGKKGDIVIDTTSSSVGKVKFSMSGQYLTGKVNVGPLKFVSARDTYDWKGVNDASFMAYLDAPDGQVGFWYDGLDCIQAEVNGWNKKANVSDIKKTIGVEPGKILTPYFTTVDVVDTFEGTVNQSITQLFGQDMMLDQLIKNHQSYSETTYEKLETVSIAQPFNISSESASSLIDDPNNDGKLVHLTKDDIDLFCFKLNSSFGEFTAGTLIYAIKSSLYENQVQLFLSTNYDEFKDSNGVVYYGKNYIEVGANNVGYIEIHSDYDHQSNADEFSEGHVIYKSGFYIVDSSSRQLIQNDNKDFVNLQGYAKKESIPTKTSQLENDSEYVKRFILNIDNIAPGVSGTLTKNTWDKITGDYLVCVNSIGDEYLFNNVQIAGNSNERFIYFRDHISKKDVEIFISFNYLNNTGNYTIKLS